MRLLNKVEGILRDNPHTRDSDKSLLLSVWSIEGLHLDEKQRVAFMGCSTAESVTRCRRALKAHYPATPEVDARRYDKFVQYKRYNDWD